MTKYLAMSDELEKISRVGLIARGLKAAKGMFRGGGKTRAARPRIAPAAPGVGLSVPGGGIPRGAATTARTQRVTRGPSPAAAAAAGPKPLITETQFARQRDIRSRGMQRQQQAAMKRTPEYQKTFGKAPKTPAAKGKGAAKPKSQAAAVKSEAQEAASMSPWLVAGAAGLGGAMLGSAMSRE